MSVFLSVPPSEWVASNELAFAIRDRFPVSKGHTLVIPRRLVPDWFSATADEQRALFALVDEVKRGLDAELRPDGYNVGFNAGEAAGQTVMHLHVHVIPRFRGDMDDPRGGVRHVIPGKGNYLRRAAPLSTGGEDDPFARHILPLFDEADDIAIVAAFVQQSGLNRIRTALLGAVARGARVRLVTGDYLDITQPSALESLLDWQATGVDADEGHTAGKLESRVVEVDKLPGHTRSFHPKSWRFESSRFGIAFVGSSNLSSSALDTGIEWNLRVDREQDALAYGRICQAFEQLWASAHPFDAAWVRAYAGRVAASHPLPPGEVGAEIETEPPLPEPHEVQVEALARLRGAREQSRRRALVVLATGLGKTWLSVFDYQQFREEVGGRPRVLFLAHRRELLRQAASSYRRLLRQVDPGARIGHFVEDESDLSADLVFASVAKLSRPDGLRRLAGQRFDYVVVDEVHHAAASSYRRILAALDPRFLLGLTATPDRADAADILGLFDDHLAYEAGIGRGIELGRLVPFRYLGVKDDIDYASIPWRNHRFDPEELARAAQTEARMATLWRAWQDHPGQRTLVFCCTVQHATFVRDWLRTHDVKVSAVFSGPGSDDRDGSLRAFERGELDALCSVDMFNEGVDIPAIDRVVMLRPTESRVVFLQQLGRGLRASDGKDSVTVVDFVGNHRIFVERLRTLLSAAGADGQALRALLASPLPPELPEGCAVELELDAKDMLSKLFQVKGADEVERAYRELRLERGERPRAGELQRLGYLPIKLREHHGGWFDFVRAEGDLGADGAQAFALAGGLLREVETGAMTKSFKMVLLEAMIEADALLDGIDVRELARRSHAILRRSPELFADVVEELRVQELSPELEKKWLAYWRDNPIKAWTTGGAKGPSWFRLDAHRLVLALPASAQAQLEQLAPTLAQMVSELVDYRLALYRARQRPSPSLTQGFTCRVTWNKRDPILKLPDRKAVDVPEGETDARLPDGSIWQFRMAKEFCNVARPAGTAQNRLPELLQGWFGPAAGHPGTAFQVRFRSSPDGLWVEPVRGVASRLVSLSPVPTYPDLKAAAGHATSESSPETVETVLLPEVEGGPNRFAVRVAGSSMAGGSTPIRSGDWAILRPCPGASPEALVGQAVLAELPGEAGGNRYQLKRLVRRDEAFWLKSDNPEGPTQRLEEGTRIVARLERSIAPEALAPAIGEVLDREGLSAAFGFPDLEPLTGRQGGHLFTVVAEKGLLLAPGRLRLHGLAARPGETAYVLAQWENGRWRYLGVAQQAADDTWQLPEVDFQTWRRWGEGREVSRQLPPAALEQARHLIAKVLAFPGERRWLETSTGQRARVLGPSKQGGLRIDGGEGGFRERTVSEQDIAWALLAARDVEEQGGRLDEERVNRLRYLE